MLAILASDKSETLGHHARGTSLSPHYSHTHTIPVHDLHLHSLHIIARCRHDISVGVRIVRCTLHPCQTRSQSLIITRGAPSLLLPALSPSTLTQSLTLLSLPALTPWAWTARVLVGRSFTSSVHTYPLPGAVCRVDPAWWAGHSPTPDEEHRPC